MPIPTLLPLEEHPAHEVLNFYTYSGTIPVNRGTFVKIGGSGFTSESNDTQFLGNPGAAYGNTVSQRYGVLPYVSVCTSGSTPIGCLLFDVKEVDENGDRLILHPHKWHEIHAVPSGKAVPILTRGNVMYSGISGTVTAGQTLRVSDDGGLNTVGAAAAAAVALGAKDSKGWCYIKVNCV